MTPFRDLAVLFEKLESTSSSSAMTSMLARFLPALSPEEVRMTAYFLAGRIGPSFSAPEIGIGQVSAARAVAESSGQGIANVRKLIAATGDVGTAAETLITRRSCGLMIGQVFRAIKAIAYAKGSGAQQAKVKRLAELLSRASGLEAKYIVRTVLGTYRIGVAEMTFLSGLAQAFAGKRDQKTVLENAYNVLSDLGEVAYRAARYGVAALKQARPVPGIPVRMMLATRVEDLDEVPLHIPGEMFVEFKYDGERIQIHKNTRGEIYAFSRRLENITHQYPEVIVDIRAALKATTAIVEGEVVAIDRQTGKLQPFQLLMRRKRKYGIERYQREIPVALFLFDLLSLNGKNLLAAPLVERKELLAKHLKSSRTAHIGTFIRSSDMTDAKRYFHEAIKQGAEGIVIKGAASPYQAAHRGWHWIKFKREYEKQLADTFDVVVVGALYGKGARAGTFGSILVAAFDPKTNRHYSFTKVGAGFTEKMLHHMSSSLKPYQRPSKHRLVDADMAMDIWLDPVKVIEIRGADLTISPVHTVASTGSKSGGIAIRFPRFLRLRDDKEPEQATTVREIWQMYQRRLAEAKRTPSQKATGEEIKAVITGARRS